MTHDSSADVGTPIPWEKLKEIQDAHELPRPRLGAVLGAMLVGLAGLAFVFALLAAMDPGEAIEPVRFLVLVAVSFGLLAGGFGGLLLLDR